MKLLAQRGEDTFLIEEDSKYFLVNTEKKTSHPLESPDVLYRQGYCEEPNPTKEQLGILLEIL